MTLGDTNTDIEGSDFSLPSGAQIDEDANGNLVIKDSTGTIVFTRDETAGEWVTDNINTNSLSTAQGTIDSLDGTSLQYDEVNETITQKSGETVTSAITRASAGDRVVLLAGTFTEDVNIGTADLTVIGAGRGTLIDGTTSTAIETTASGITLQNLAVKSTAGGGNNARGIRIDGSENLVTNVWVEESDQRGIEIASSGVNSRMVSVYCDSANIDGDDISLFVSDCLVDDVIGTIVDNGTGNVVGDTL